MLHEDANGVVRIFATHHVQRDISGVSDAAIAVRWYVIDPDLDDFPGTSWAPSILHVGNIEWEDHERAYHPAIAVNAVDQAAITFTMSSSTDWPQLWRVMLSSTYTSVSSITTAQLGPSFPYTENSWADYSDLQADPSNCTFWSHETLVAQEGQGATGSDDRQTWLTNFDVNCGGNANFNGDSVVDESDLSDFLAAHAVSDRSADMNGNRKVDAVDAIIFMDAYARARK